MPERRLDLDKLLDQLDLLDLARAAGAKLRKVGQSWRGACPLHGGDNPTGFSIKPDRDHASRLWWWCHKCNGGRGGDALHFIQTWQNLEFLDAVNFAASRLNLPLAELGLTPEAAQEHAQRERRRDVLELAARFYRIQFVHSPAARRYARSRGFNLGVMHRLGYSNSQGLAQFLAAHNADLALAREAGVLRNDGRDFTANAGGAEASPGGWLVYIHRSGRRVDYLLARALAPVEPNDKSRNLPGPRQVYRAEVPGDRDVALVEGPANAETLKQLGLSAWAMCGAALSEADVQALGRKRTVYLALDDDTHRAGDEALQAERAEVTAARRRKLADRLGPLTMIPPEIPHKAAKDPNAWLQAHPDLDAQAVRTWLRSGRNWLEVRLRLAGAADGIEKAEHITAVAGLLARLPQSLQATEYKKAGKLLGMTAGDLRAAHGANANDGQHAAEVQDGCLALYGTKLLTAALITHQQTVNDGTNPPVVRYTIHGRLADNTPLRELTVLASEFDSLGWLTEWGARVIKLVPKGQQWQIVRAIQELSVNGGGQMIEEEVFAHTGWSTPAAGGSRSFLTTTGRLTPDGLDAATRIDLGESNMRHALPAPPDDPLELKKAVRASLDFLFIGPLRVTAPIWAAMYAAPLTPVRSLDALIHVYGSTSSGKSTVSHVALGHFGPSFVTGRKYHAQIGWDATYFALEHAMFVSKDVPLIIDDYAPQFMSAADRDKLRKNAAQVIRNLGNRVGRGRGSYDNGNGGIKTIKAPRGLVLSTAENTIEGQSLANRMLYVPIEKNEVLREGGNETLDDAQGHSGGGLYAQAMSAYLVWLMRNWHAAVAQFNTEAEAAAGQARAVLPSGFDRLPDYFGVLHGAQALAMQAFTDLKLIVPALADDYVAQNRAALLELVKGQAGRVAEQSPAKMFLAALASLLRRERAYLAPRKRLNSDGRFTPPERAELIGWYDPQDKGAIWISTLDALIQVKTYYQGDNVTFDTSRDALKRLMLQSDMLRATDPKDGNAEVSKWMGEHGNNRALEVDLEKVLAEWEIDLRYPRPLHNLRAPAEDNGGADDEPRPVQTELL